MWACNVCPHRCTLEYFCIYATSVAMYTCVLTVLSMQYTDKDLDAAKIICQIRHTSYLLLRQEIHPHL